MARPVDENFQSFGSPVKRLTKEALYRRPSDLISEAPPLKRVDMGLKKVGLNKKDSADSEISGLRCMIESQYSVVKPLF